MSQKQQEIEELLGPAIRALGLELLGSEYSAGNSSALLRIYIEAPQRAVTIDDCEAASREISALLDVNDPIDGHYTLEVSSPGIERPLSRRSQIDRHTGARATIRTHAPLGGGSSQKTFHGRLVGSTPEPGSTDDRDGRVSLQDDEGVVHEIPLSLIRRANLVYEPVRESDGPRGKKAVNRG
jgi:ribosome maturation factor RimP